MKKLYFIFNVFLILFIASCTTHVAKNQVDRNIVQKEMTRYVTIEWKLNPKFITDVPQTAKEKLIKSCNSDKFILVKVSTVDFEKTKGTFRCN
tara:strand:- start:156 stop:434 length:279 start_codon:yes stop_codon:yes gene_type:complete